MKNKKFIKFIHIFEKLDVIGSIMADVPLNDDSKSRMDYPNLYPIINELYESVSDSDLYFDFLDEIHKNLYEHPDSRIIYVKDILRSFSDILTYFIATSKISSKSHEAIRNFIKNPVDLRNMNPLEVFPEKYVVYCVSGLNAFIVDFDVICLKFQIDLIELQNQMNVYLFKHRDTKFLVSKGYKDELQMLRVSLKPVKTEISGKLPPRAEKINDKLIDVLKKYDFLDIPSVAKLSNENQSKLLQMICSNQTPYQIAMFEHLGYLKYLIENHFKTMTAMSQEISKWIDSDEDGRSVRGNIATLHEKTNENKARYTAHNYIDLVKEDYKSLK